MRKIWNLALNDVRVHFSTPVTLVFFLVLPLVFTTVIGSAMSNLYGENDQGTDTRFPVLVVDLDNSVLSSELGEALAASSVIRPVLKPEDKALTLFEDGQAPALLTIPSGFGSAVLSGQQAELRLLKSRADNRVLAVEQAIQAAATEMGDALAAALVSLAEADRQQPAGFKSAEDRQAYFEQGLSMAQELLDDPPARVQVVQAAQSAGTTGEIASGFEQSSAGQLVTWTLITLLGASQIFVNERLGGTLRRLVVTPSSKATILAGKISGRLGMGIVQMIILIGFGALFFGVNWGQSPVALAMTVFAFALAAVAMGVMLGTLVKTGSQASGLTTLFAMLMAALGGAWWPLEVTPALYQTVVKVLPTTWAMMAFNDIIVRGMGVADVWPKVLVLLGFAVLFFFIGIWRFRFE